MFIKIYFNDKPLFLCDDIEEALQPFLHHDDAVFIDELSSPALKSMIHEMQLDKVHAGIYYHPDLETLKKAFWKKFTVIKAAGGLVQNEKHEILFMFRRGKWDLPKGKLDPGETLETCAVREVREETGLEKVTLKKPLITTYHTYHESGKHILKESYWYTMLARGTDNLVPQTEEDIQEVKWVPEKKLNEMMGNTFPSIKDVIEKFES